MAVSAIRSVSIPSWINEKNVLAALSGLYINCYWENSIKCDNNVDQKPISTVFDASSATFWVSYNLFTSFSRIESTLSPERVTPYAWGFFPNPRGPHFYVALLLTALNVVKIFKEFKANQPVSPEKDNTHVPTEMGRFVAIVWKATPYLMIITNIAVTIFQIRQGDSSAWIQLAFIGITLIDITIWKQVEYRWYLEKFLGYPIKAAALYCGNTNIRCSIIFSHIFNWALRQKVVQQKIEEICAELLAKLKADLLAEFPSSIDNAKEN